MQLLKTTSLQICYIRNTKENILSEADEEAARQLLLKLHPDHSEVIADLCAFTVSSDQFPASVLSSACVD